MGTYRLYPRLYLYSERNYCGNRYVWRGNRALRDLSRLYGSLGSLRFYSPWPDATLVLFSRTNFRGRFRIYRGTTNIRDLHTLFDGHGPRSLIIARACLTPEQIRVIRRTGCLPPGFRVV